MDEQNLHDRNDEAELDRLESNLERRSTDAQVRCTQPSKAKPWVITSIIVVAIVFFALALIAIKSADSGSANDEAKAEVAKDSEKSNGNDAITLDAEVLNAAGVQIESVTQRPAVALLTVAGTVEANPQTTQQVTSLVSGRVERIFVSIGDRVSAGQTVAIVTSTEVAEKFGKWRESTTQVDLARKNLDRVRLAENRAAVLEAKARLDEADATLKRTKRLIELGAGAGKDLISAETNFQTAKADYDYQRNISLNKEIAEAEAALRTATVDAEHQHQSLQALGIDPKKNSANIASVPLRAPVSGIVTERGISGGAGIQAGTSLMTIANISSVWVIANVPENEMSRLRVGTPAEIRIAALGNSVLNGRIAYIAPNLTEETRTGQIRIEVPNEGERLKAGMFVEVGFQAGTGSGTGDELVVPSAAVQRLGERTIVFIPKDDGEGTFEIRDVEIGSLVEGYHRVLSGLSLGEKVVTKGSFTLKTQMQKGELGEE